MAKPGGNVVWHKNPPVAQRRQLHVDVSWVVLLALGVSRVVLLALPGDAEPQETSKLEELKRRILAFIEFFNHTLAKPFRWTYIPLSARQFVTC